MVWDNGGFILVVKGGAETKEGVKFCRWSVVLLMLDGPVVPLPVERCIQSES